MGLSRWHRELIPRYFLKVVRILTLVVLICSTITLSHSQGFVTFTKPPAKPKPKPKEPVRDVDCYVDIGLEYRGRVSKTKSGKTCKYWKDTAHKDKGAKFNENYCRGTKDSIRPWCYIDSAVGLEHCDIPQCEACYDGSNLLYQYQGKVNVTESGLTCQRWDKQTPHKYRPFPPMFQPDNTLAHNYCRGMPMGIQPWCYTTNPKVRREKCVLPLCPGVDVKKCYFRDIQIHRGNVSKSVSGRTCLRWDSKEAILKCPTCMDLFNFPDPTISDAANYCRQLVKTSDGLYKPFCITDAGLEACDVKPCPDKCTRIEEDFKVMAMMIIVDGKTVLMRGSGKKFTTVDTMQDCIDLCKKTRLCYRWSYGT